MTTEEQSRGALLGLAVGDALGVALEFQPPGSFEPLTDMIGGGPFGLEPGEWTDDTSMALCLAESLLQCNGFDPFDQLRRYVRWYREGHHSSTGRCFDIGNTVRGALERFERTGDPWSGSTDPNAAGNGSLMRLAPIPLFFASDPPLAIRIAAGSSRTTHGAPEAVDACRYFAGLLLGTLQGRSKEEILAPGFTPVPGGWDADPLSPAIADIAAGSFRRKDPPAIQGTGYVVRTLEAALWAFAKSASFEHGALLAVNLGDDADTTGAIFGQIAGAHYGVDGIPRHWTVKLARRDVIEDMARRLAVAGRTARRATDSSDDPDRPGATVPIPDSYWLLEGQLLAGEYPGRLDEHGTRPKLERMLASGIRSFIDLTETDDPLEPYDAMLMEVAAARGIEVRYQRLPIRDMDVPRSDVMAEILSLIGTEIAAGRPVYVHCWGGIGRTGTVAGCWLVEQGQSCDEAFARINELRAPLPDGRIESPQTAAQRAFVRGWPGRR